jgi:hypothetical protein
MIVERHPSWGIDPPRFVMKVDNLAWMVTCSPSTYTVKLDPSVSSLDHELDDEDADSDESSLGDFDPRKYCQISQDCSCLAAVYLRESKVQFQIQSLFVDSLGEII